MLAVPKRVPELLKTESMVGNKGKCQVAKPVGAKFYAKKKRVMALKVRVPWSPASIVR